MPRNRAPDKNVAPATHKKRPDVKAGIVPMPLNNKKLPAMINAVDKKAKTQAVTLSICTPQYKGAVCS